MINKKEEIGKLRLKGWTLQAIGDEFNISR